MTRYQSLAFVDVETTGLDPKRDRVIEIGIVKLDKFENVTTYTQLINPGFKISKEVRAMTGIKLKELEKAPTIEETIQTIQEQLKVDLFVAHNSKFDYGFISEEFARFNLDLAMPHLDTVKLARTFYPNYMTYNLDSIIARLKIKIDRRHRALDDAQVLLTLLRRIQMEFGEDDLYETIEKLITLPKKRQIDIFSIQPSLL